MANSKQFEVEKYLAKVPQATLEEIYQNVPFGYYHNGHKHLGEILSRMVKSGKIARVKKGVYRYVNATEFMKMLDRKQINLFSGSAKV